MGILSTSSPIVRYFRCPSARFESVEVGFLSSVIYTPIGIHIVYDRRSAQHGEICKNMSDFVQQRANLRDGIIDPGSSRDGLVRPSL
jgi:hypothetical protein